MKKNSAAFTLIELLVVISIIAILATFAVPAVTTALTKGQMTGTMNNARQLYLAAFQMATDGAANSDPNFSWPGDDSAIATSSDLTAFAQKLVQNDYLKAGDLQKILSAPGATCTATADGANPPNVTLGGTSALKVYKVRDVDPASAIFVTTSNYIYNTVPTATAAPYADKGFVVVRKGGDASTFRKNQSTQANYGNDVRKFQAAIGKLPGDADGTISAESDKILKYPQ
jgi:prepilin-type N-terminal cleavage/methylation domain-containing protein